MSNTEYPSTDEQVKERLEHEPITLALYMLQRNKGLAVAEAWSIVLESRPDFLQTPNA